MRLESTYFEKVSYEQFLQDMQATFKNEYKESVVKDYYDKIQLPTRSTSGSAGYDFHSTVPVSLFTGATVTIPTGIRVHIDSGWFLMCVPRSSLGFKYRMQLDNGTGIIDCDYVNSDNEGHIFAKITNDGKQGKLLSINAGERFMQGIFVPYGITSDDVITGQRTGGIGSTGK